MNRPGELGVIFAVFRLTSEMPVVRAFTGMDVPAGQFPVTGVTAAHQQDPPGDVADCRERGRCHTGGGGGVRLMVILAADARAPGPASLPAGRASLDRGPLPPLRSAPTPITATPRRAGGGLIRMTAEILGVRRRRGTHSTPLHQRRSWAAAAASLPTEGPGPATGPESSGVG